MRVLRYIHENFPTSNAINLAKQKEIPTSNAIKSEKQKKKKKSLSLLVIGIISSGYVASRQMH